MGMMGPAAWLILHFLLLHFDLSVKEKYSKAVLNQNRHTPRWFLGFQIKVSVR